MRVLVIPILLWIAVLPVIASAIEVSGDVWGTWSPVNNPYEVVGEIRVPPESTLVIEPGVFVNFQGHYKFVVDSLATFLAIGTETDSIYFTTDDTATGWHGIRLMYADANSQISYCRLEYGRAIGDWPDMHGGAIFCYYSSPTISSNAIKSNFADFGGGISCWGVESTSWINNNTVTGNSVEEQGGGIYCYISSPVINGNTVSSNSVNGSFGKGGGIYCLKNPAPIIINNTISGNSVAGYYGKGGGIWCWESDPTISNNIITGNYADEFGGGIYCRECSPMIGNNTISGNCARIGGGIYCGASSPTVSNNTVSENSADRYGGGLYCRDNSNPTITGNTISENSVTGDYGNGGGICSRNDARPIISRNTISGNSAAGEGGGIFCFYSDATVTDNTVSENAAGHAGGGIYWSYSSPTIGENTISANSAQCGGGIYCWYSSGSPISNNTICNNEATDFGGGLSSCYSTPIISNNVITGNSAYSAYGYGGGIYCWAYSPTINNNTISRNSAGDYGGAIFCEDSSPRITNNILWGDTAPSGAEMFVLNGDPTVIYCDVQGGWEGEGNIDVDPLFRGPGRDDFHLMADYCGDPYNSPCIDAGHPDSLDALLDCSHGLGVDRCDIGAYGGNNSGWPTGVSDDLISSGSIPNRVLLFQNYPNPFNSSTSINYVLPEAGFASVRVYNLRGQLIKVLTEGFHTPGHYSLLWRGDDKSGNEVASGVYFLRLEIGKHRPLRKMSVLK